MVPASCPRYRRQNSILSAVPPVRTVREKQSHESDEVEFSIVRFQNGCKKQAIFFVEDSTEEEIKSKVNTNFGLVKYFDNVNKMDNPTDCLLN